MDMDDLIIKCTLCGATYMTKWAIKYHQELNKPLGIQPRNKGGTFTCDRCLMKEPNEEREFKEKNRKKNKSKKNFFLINYKSIKNHIHFLIPILLILFCLSWYIFKTKPPNSINLEQEIRKLKVNYQNQETALWQNVKKVINTTDTTQALILMYKNNGETAEHLAIDIAKILNKKYNTVDKVLFYENAAVADYGESLLNYKEKLKSFKHLIVSNLHMVPGKTARIFHYLCDDIEELIPSHIIFTMKDINDNRGALFRADKILQESWKDLEDHELYPLISRVARNVVEVK